MQVATLYPTQVTHSQLTFKHGPDIAKLGAGRVCLSVCLCVCHDVARTWFGGVPLVDLLLRAGLEFQVLEDG